MHIIAKLTSVLLVSAVGLLSTQSAAAAPQVSCAAGMNRLMPDEGHWLNVVGTRVTARGAFGFSSFTMRDGFQIESTPLHTPAVSTQTVFTANRHNSDVYTGYYHEVFPERGNGDEDRWQFWVNRSGQLWLRSVTWGGSWKNITNVTCFEGPEDQLVMVAHVDNPGFGTDFLTFLMNYGTLI